MKIREARPEDLDRLLELYKDLEGPYETATTLERAKAANLFTRVLLDPDQHTLVAEDREEVIGTVVLAVIPNLAHGGAPYAVVENVVVDGVRRGAGIGTALMKAAAEKARKAGAYKLALCSNFAREEAHAFYRSLEMQQTHGGFEVKL